MNLKSDPNPRNLFMRNQWAEAQRRVKEKQREEELQQYLRKRNTLKTITEAIKVSDKAEVRIGENQELQLCLSFPPLG